MRARRVLIALVLAAGAGLWGAAGVIPDAAASTPQPVSTASMPDPGVLLNSGHFYAFSTGTGLRESTASIAAGPWTAPANKLNSTGLPSWIDTSKGNWAPDMIETTSDKFVVYFAAALPGTGSNPTGNDSKPAGGARCIGSAESTSPTGPFTVDPEPVVCLTGYGASDDMTADPGNRTLGEGVIDPSPAFVTVDGAQELFLVYKTQGQNGKSTIRMVRLADDDGTTVLGDSHQLLNYVDANGNYQDTIEGPSLIQNGSWFILFVAHGNYDTCGYSTEWFKSQHIWAWTSTAGTTLLSQPSTGLCGPGGADATASEVSGQDRLFLHGWVKPGTTTPSGANNNDESGAGQERVMYAAVLTFGSDGYTPSVSFLAPSS
jgi:arabinan endo-1,5-alpha-L-arabinosidase